MRSIAAARPGDFIVLAAGDYGSVHAAGLRGEAGRPIVLRGEDPESLPRFTGGVHLSDVAHLTIERIAIVEAPSNGLNIDDGGSFETPSHHVVLREIVVRDCGGRGNLDGIKLSGVEEFLIERCTLERWGRGGSAVDMVGCRRGRLEQCLFRDRAEDPAASGVQAKGGSREIQILRCRFEHAGQRAVNIGGSTGLAYFRPRPEGFEARDISVLGCTFVGSMAPIAFVGVDGATVRWNTFHRPQRWLLRILQETREPGFVPCRDGVFSDNLVVYRLGEIAGMVNVGPDTQPERFRFERNYWFAEDAPERSIPSLPTMERDARGGSDPLLVDAQAGDLRPSAGSPASAHGASALPARATADAK